jgi:hypothetical protein
MKRIELLVHGIIRPMGQGPPTDYLKVGDLRLEENNFYFLFFLFYYYFFKVEKHVGVDDPFHFK